MIRPSAPALVAIAVLTSAGAAMAREVGADGSPVLVLTVERPWQGVLIRTTPDFVLYENRFAIQRRFSADGPDEYFGELIDEARYAALMKRLRESVGGARWAPWYQPREQPSDQPTTMIFVRLGETTIVSAVSGREACKPSPTGYDGQSEVPRDLCRLIDEIAHFQLRKRTPWVPVEVDVELLPADVERGLRMRTWPKGWPGIRSSHATKEGRGYSIRMDGRYLSRVDAFLKSLGRSGVFVLAGKTWVAAYRVPYPNEEEWQKRFEAAW